jgi:mannose-1-phosphate guanylyltransferase/phosphomannomutase
MKAVIMAGGEGTRLRPLTANQPKPMLPLANRPIMEHIVRHVSNHGIREIVVTVQFLASQVRNYFGDGADMGVDLSYATEPRPLGTAGSVKNAAEQLRETFVVVSGDGLTDIDLNAAAAFHRERGAMATVVTKRMENPLEFGIVITQEDGRIERFLEKPHWGQVFSDTINTGIYVLEPDIFDYIPAEGSSDFADDVFPTLLGKGAPLYAWVAEGYWEDVGNLDAYRRAHQDILDGKVRMDIRGFQVRPGVWLGEGAEVDPDAILHAPVLIGDFAKVEAGATVREYTVIGTNVVVKEEAFVHRAVVQDNAYIGPGAHVRGCVIGRGADVHRNGRIEDGVVVGDNANIGVGAVLLPNVKVYPFKTVEPGAVVTKSIIWEGRGARTLFSESGVAGLANSTGVHCDDLELAPAPALRFAATMAGGSGGMYVRTSPRDSQAIEIAVFGDDGTDLDDSAKRKVERTYNREEFRRAFGREMGELAYPPRAVERYTAALVAALDTQAIREHGFKVVIDAGGGTCSLVLPYLLPRFGLDSLVVNGELDEDRMAPSERQREQDVARLARLVTTSGADLGVRFDGVAERLMLVDGTGQVIPLVRALLLYVDLVAQSAPEGTVALPVSTTRLAGELAARHGWKVRETKLSSSAITGAAQAEGVSFAGGEGGGYVFPTLHPTYDGLMAFGKLLEMLATQRVSLAEAFAALPPSYVVRSRVPTPWELKGAVMRQVVEATKSLRTKDVDGIKVYHPASGEDGDWVLVIPDTTEPVTHLWAEAGSEPAARALLDEYEALVRRATDQG